MATDLTAVKRFILSWVWQFIKTIIKQGVDSSNGPKTRLPLYPDFHKRILFRDEAHFWLNGYVNKLNCRISSEANPQHKCRNTVTSRKTDCLVRFMGWWNPSSKTMKATTLQSMVIGIEP
ncbi:uncharacterized protein TNCV_3491601 [Trichonephila clavipes]|nr:uncharacterized protein TNCV_3491601 [Trichonephila clavipes]